MPVAGDPVTDDDAVRLIENVIDATSDVRVGAYLVPSSRTATAVVEALREHGWQPAP